MARGKTAKLYRTFVKGLITEAGFLTYPEDASTDELNTVPSPKGSRNRRLGIEEEPAGSDVELLDEGATSVTSEFTWKAAANKYDANFLVQQVGNAIHFFEINTEPLSTHKKGFIIGLVNYKTEGTTDEQVANTRVQFASGKGLLFIVSEVIEPLVVEYDADTDNISTIRVIIQIRDFDGVPDGLANDAEPSTLSKEHFYNLKNQGWLTPGSV